MNGLVKELAAIAIVWAPIYVGLAVIMLLDLGIGTLVWLGFGGCTALTFVLNAGRREGGFLDRWLDRDLS